MPGKWRSTPLIAIQLTMSLADEKAIEASFRTGGGGGAASYWSAWLVGENTPQAAAAE
jgi:hypothetical protein